MLSPDPSGQPAKPELNDYNQIEMSWTSFVKDDEILKQELEVAQQRFEKRLKEGRQFLP
jgi:hypothetical protein